MHHDFKGRREDRRLITGQGRYTADQNVPGQAHAHFLRADRAHAEIVSIDTGPARAAPGVIAVFTGEDLTKAGYKSSQPIMIPNLRVPQRSALAVGRVRYVGEAVALVVAETELQAMDALEKIQIDYRELPVLVDADDALAANAPVLYDEMPGNLAVLFEYGDAAKAQEAFSKADLVVELALDAQRISGNPMEPKACLVSVDAKGMFDVYAPTQGMSPVQHELAEVTGVDVEQIRVWAQDVGGAFGVRGETYMEFIALFYAAQTLKRAVKWNGTRSESIASDHHARAAKLKGMLALDKAGNFLGIKVEWVVNVGAYCSHSGPFINTMAAPRTMAVNAYRIPAVYGRHRLAFTNTTPTTAFRGAGRPNVTYLIERLIDEASLRTGIDRVELRRRNLLAKSAFPYQTPTGSTYDTGDPPALLEDVLQRADWSGFSTREAESKRRGKLRGIGCAMFIEPSGSPGKERVVLKFDPKGDLILYAATGPSGQGHETVFPDIVANILGIDAEKITLRASDPLGPSLNGVGTFGSRSVLSYGNGFAMGAQEIVHKGAQLAASQLEVAPDDVKFENGRYHVKGTDLSLGLVDVIEKHKGAAEHPLDTTTDYAAPSAFSSGAHIAEVEIDPETGIVEITNYVAVDDCGNVINPMLVDGQLHGGIMQGVGQALGEHIVYDRDTGQLMTATFMDYVMPRADDWTKEALFSRPVPSTTNQLGVKGAGEAGATGSVPCVANAVMHALGGVGVAHLEMPYTAHRVWNAIDAAR